MNKSEKQQVIEELSRSFAESASVLLVDFTGINVADETELRRTLTESGSDYRVVKNRLALRAAVDTPVDGVRDHFRGPTAVAFSQQDPIALAKTVTEFLKTHPGMSVKAGVLERSVLTAKDVEALAQLPSREELLSKVVYLLLAPVRNFAAALQAPLRNLASVLSQIEGTGKESS